MTSKTVIKKILGVKKVKIEDIIFDDNDETLYVYVSLVKGQRYRCPICHKRCKGYDTITIHRKWRSLDFGPCKVYIICDVKRVSCKDHGIISEDVPFAYHRSRFTKEFERQAAYLALHLSKSDVADIMRIDWRTVGDIIRKEKERLEPDSHVRCKDLRMIGIDETSYKKGHKYLTVIVDHDTNEVVWCHEGHGKEILKIFFDSLSIEELSNIKLVSADGARWIKETLDMYLDDYTFCIDRYHVTSWCIAALDELRKELWRKAKAETPKRRRGRPKKGEEVKETIGYGKGYKYALGKNPENLTDHQRSCLDEIKDLHPKMFKGYQLKEGLRKIFECDKEDAEAELKRWLSWACRSKLRPFVELSKKIRRHKEAILATCRYRLSNARIEATNNKIKVLIRKAYGFRNIQNLKALIMIVCSDLFKEIRMPYKDRLDIPIVY